MKGQSALSLLHLCGFHTWKERETFFTGMNETTGFVFVFHFLRRRCWVCPGHNHTRASVLIKQCEFCTSFCVLYSNFRWESNETEVKMIFFYRALSWPRKFAPILNHSNVKKKPKRELQSLAFFLTLRQIACLLLIQNLVLISSCGKLGFIVMRLTWKALYKHVNEAQQQLRSQEERVHNKRGWLKGTSGRKRPCDSPICIKERNCTRQ